MGSVRISGVGVSGFKVSKFCVGDLGHLMMIAKQTLHPMNH